MRKNVRASVEYNTLVWNCPVNPINWYPVWRKVGDGSVVLGADARADTRKRLMKRPQKIILGEMREMGVRGVLVYCSDFKCSHWGRISADRWPDHVRLSDLESLFVCQACGTRPADLRPNFHWEKEQRQSCVAETN